eukprot:CAMPEP_0184356204 /NCGR_PEP_ID=MMETSP1089-20130417/101315_1 /TAXON_ID=38269 ORGANISM="Gloeochaete wittrockiana, Strain SAG46.84" /NCGR_SAMPLE_ID=MMETSP1089 /ASSEMBLY_ACC=CAM_ASM_000445 /LENGTH=43 /DNA_ID= /DNA_START= /DNA_END= /DNA_ORIENTATION=
MSTLSDGTLEVSLEPKAGHGLVEYVASKAGLGRKQAYDAAVST